MMAVRERIRAIKAEQLRREAGGAVDDGRAVFGDRHPGMLRIGVLIGEVMNGNRGGRVADPRVEVDQPRGRKRRHDIHDQLIDANRGQVTERKIRAAILRTDRKHSRNDSLANELPEVRVCFECRDQLLRWLGWR